MEEALKAIGLNSKEIAIYLAILKLGQTHIFDIARQAKIPRPTVYGYLEKLLAEQLITTIIRGKRRYYIAEDPAKISQILSEKQEKIKKILPSLRKIYQKTTHRPVIRSYEGISGIKKLLADVLISIPKGGSYDLILNSKQDVSLLNQVLVRHQERCFKKKISIRVITERSEFTKDWDKTQKQPLREVRFVPKGQKLPVSTLIYSDKVATFSLQGLINGTITTQKQIANLQRLEFEYMWAALKEKSKKSKGKSKKAKSKSKHNQKSK